MLSGRFYVKHICYFAFKVKLVKLTGEVGACAVGPQVAAVRVGRVALKQALVLGLHFGDVQHGRVPVQPLNVDLPVVHPLSVQGVGVVGLRRAHDADFAVWRRRQVHGPLKVLLHALLVARHIAPDGHVGTLGPDQGSALHRHHPLGHGDGSCKQVWGEGPDRGRVSTQVVKREVETSSVGRVLVGMRVTR